MPKAKWILSSPDNNGPLGGPIAVYDQADLDRRLKAAKDAGVTVNYHEAE